jgi:hypothetical protein
VKAGKIEGLSKRGLRPRTHVEDLEQPDLLGRRRRLLALPT